uniref:FK506-binding protein 5-like n=1 Tax=Tanacetum cinerariifolium TaxID=118510 RepID=A0A6L2N340_TANCI|nr:FK506-binding protein 5-like [Tanacetum cinerariifolium]
MDSCNNNLTKSTTSIKHSFKDAGGNNENEMNSDMVLKSKGVISTKKKTPTKNFMSPTISAANKKKILTERNEDNDVVEQNSVEWSSSFGSKAVKFPVVGDVDGGVDFKMYDPVKNYLSPRPKFLRYNPNRRRKILKEIDEGNVRNSTNSSINASCNLELGVGSLGTTDSSSQKESVERVENVIDKEGKAGDDEGDEFEDDEEEVVEYEEDIFWSLKGLLKWSLVVVALVLMTQGICSVNSPTGSDTLEPVGDFSDWSFVNRAVGLNFSEAVGFKDRAYVYGAASVDYFRIATRDTDLEARRFEKVEVNHDYEGLNMVETVNELVQGENGLNDDVVVETVEVENGLIDDVVDRHIVRDETDVTVNEMSSKQEDTSHLQLTETSPEQEVAESEVLEIDDVDFSQDVVSVQLDEVVNDETDVIMDDMWSKQEYTDHLQRVGVLQEHESAETEVMETDDVEVNKEVSDQLLTADPDQDGFGEYMNVAEKVIGDITTTELAGTDPAVTVLTGLVLVLLISVGAVYHSKRTKSTPAVTTPVEKEDIKEAEPSTNPSSLIQQKEEQTLVTSAASLAEPDVSKEISHINAPSVELLGEFVFGEEVTSSVRSYSISPEANASNSPIQTTSVSFSKTTTSHIEISTGDSRTARKPRRKAAESSSLVAPSSVRRSSRIQSRSVMSP